MDSCDSSLAERYYKFLGDIPKFGKNAKNPYFDSAYLTLDKLLDTLKPIAGKHGFRIVHNVTSEIVGTQAYMKVSTLLVGGDGLAKEFCGIPFRIDNLDAQKVGGAITYFKRYSTIAAFGIVIEGEDDDANSTVDKIVKDTTEINADSIITFGKFKDKKITYRECYETKDGKNWFEWMMKSGRPSKEFRAIYKELSGGTK